MPTFEQERGNVGQGWQPMINELHRQLRDIDPEYRVLQIKEKFGGLRYYAQPSEAMSEDEEGREIFYALIDDAEKASFTICEHCGAQENVETKPTRYWLLTLCESCRREDEIRLGMVDA